MRLQGQIRVAGTMSGTSLDGVDAAIIESDGQRVFGFGPSRYRPYTENEQETLRAALGAWPGAPESEAASAVVDLAHAEVLADLMAEPDAGPVELVGFHGQTLAHEPGGRGTHQAGDGIALAERINRPVVWDFRSADVQFGGQGAPLAPAYHHALALRMGAEEPLAFLNLGGVGNITWVDPSKPAVEDAGALLAFDTGPANAPLNDLMLTRRGTAMDRDGALAASGTVDAEIIKSFLSSGYFRRIPPKSLDRNDFSDIGALVGDLSDEDAAATLTAAIAHSVVAAAEHFPSPAEALFVTGGGRRNPVVMQLLGEHWGGPVAPVEACGFDGDMLEAQAFAHLAVRVAKGLPTTFPGTTGVPAAIGGGEVSAPLPV